MELADLATLVAWFAEPAVARWWNEPPDLASVRAKYAPRIAGQVPTQMWIVEIDRSDAGLLQSYRHVDHPEHDAAVGIPRAVGIDYLLGAAHRGRGLAGLALRGFAELVLERHADAECCVATPAQTNEVSWRALERAGFERRHACQAPGEPPGWAYAFQR